VLGEERRGDVLTRIVDDVETLQDVPLRVRCGACGVEFEPEDRHYMPCPSCGEFLGHDVLGGKELSIESLEAE
jgi:hydrogenase nickel incorporation protein HypA/HybF